MVPSSILFERLGGRKGVRRPRGSSLVREVSQAVEGSPEPADDAGIFKVAMHKEKKEQLQR